MGQLSTDDRAARMLDMLPGTYQTFWRGGQDGKLHLLRSRETQRYVHPFWPVADDDPLLESVAVSGRGTVFTFTVNHQPYSPAIKPPYVIAMVELEEQDDLRVITNIVGCEPGDVRVGMAVRVLFEEQEGLFVPVFTPA